MCKLFTSLSENINLCGLIPSAVAAERSFFSTSVGIRVRVIVGDRFKGREKV
jgi:hypothetical protein